LKYYDIAGPSCVVEKVLAERLGFKHIFVLGKETASQDTETGKGKTGVSLAYGKNNQLLLSHSKGGTRAVAPLDFHTDRRLLEALRSNETTLCVPLFPILSTYGIERSRRIYMARALVDNALSRRIETTIISMAPKPEYLCSSQQLLELGRMLDLPEETVKRGLMETNEEVGQS
jgi:hypothetical protein